MSCCIVNVNSGSSRLACPALMWLPAFPRHQACSVQLRAREGVSLSLLTGCGHKLHSVVLHLICWPLARSRSHPSFEMSHLYVTYLQAVSGAIVGSLVGHLLRIMRRTLPFDQEQYRSSCVAQLFANKLSLKAILQKKDQGQFSVMIAISWLHGSVRITQQGSYQPMTHLDKGTSSFHDIA